MSATVLVVSGEPFVESTIRHLLWLPGQTTARTSSIEQAPALIDQLLPRLVVVDLPAPDPDAASRLRDLHATTRLPLVVLAADPKALVYQLDPAVRVLPRPPDPRELEAALREALAGPAAAPTTATDPPSARRRWAGRAMAALLALAAA